MVKMKTDIIRRTDVSGYTDHTIKEALKQSEKIMTKSPLESYSSYTKTYFDKNEEFYANPIKRAIDPIEYPTPYQAPSSIELSTEEKEACLNSDEQLEKMLKSKSKLEIEDIIIKLDSNIELDYKLKKKILLSPDFFSMLISLLETSNIRKIINSLDTTNPKEQELKRELFKINIENICKNIIHDFVEDILNDLNPENSTDAEIKKMMFLEKPYKLYISKIQDPCYTYWKLDWNNPIDREIKIKFFFDDENLQIIIGNIYPGFFIDILGKDKFDNPLDLEIKNRLFLNKEVLKAVLNRFSKSMTNFYMGFILSNRQTNKPIKEKIFLDDELSQLLINKIDESDIDRVTRQLDEKDDIDNKFRRKLLLTPTRFISLLKRYRVKECIEELKELNTQNNEEATLKKAVFLTIFSPEARLINRKKEIKDAIQSLNPNDATDIDIKQTLLSEKKYRGFILESSGIYVYLNLDENNEIERGIKKDFFMNKDNQESVTNNIDVEDFLTILKMQCIEDSLDYKIKKSILLNDKILNNILNAISQPEIIQMIVCLNNGDILNSTVKKKILLDKNYIQIIINKMNQDIFLELVINLDYSNNKEDEAILNLLLEIRNFKKIERRISTLDVLAENFQEKNCLDIAKAIIEDNRKFSISVPECNVYNLMMALHDQGDCASTIELLKPFAIFNSQINQYLDHEKAENIVFKLMDPNNPKDIDIIDEILFNPDTDKKIFDLFAVYTILLVFHAQNKPIDLFQKITRSLNTDSSYVKRIMSCANVQNLSHTLDKFDFQNDNDFWLLNSFVSSENFKNSIKDGEYFDINRLRLKWQKMKLRNPEKNENENVLDIGIKVAFEFADAKNYIITPITRKIDTPEGDKRVFIYNRSIIMINQEGEQFIINVSGGSPDITPPNIKIVEKYSWLNHEPSMANCLLSWGFPEEEIIPIWNRADELSYYAARKGILTIQIEGENAHLFVPEEINNALSATLTNDLNLISNQEEKTNTRMNFLRIVLPSGQMITRPDPENPENFLPFYTEEINDTLKSAGVLKNEITDGSDASLKTM